MGKIDVTFRKPVSWLDPVGLVRTGIMAVEAGLFGSFADRRETIAALSPDADKVKKPAFSYADKDEVWFDYICDTGDGWNATYAIACLVGQAKLDVAAPAGGEKPPLLRRAEFTILGGDEVYPTASLEAYQSRMIDPFYCGNTSEPVGHKNQPTVYALPGNHDWYDGLTSFMRLFLQDKRRVGPWLGGQERTYFAIELPHRWWIWGVDVQLESDVDAPQTHYFQTYASFLKKGDRVILCTPEPSWVEGADTRLKGPIKEKSKTHDNLVHLEKMIKGRDAEIPLRIAGDLHHYARYQSGKSHLVTCGGGGAFLHSTHPLPDDLKLGNTFEPSYSLKKLFPTAQQCRDLRPGVFTFLKDNKMFGVTVGVIYALYAWVLGSASQIYLPNNQHGYLLEYFHNAPLWPPRLWWNAVHYSPLGVLLTAGITVGAAVYGYSFRRIFWVAKNKKDTIDTSRIAFIGGFVHGLLHLCAAMAMIHFTSTIHFTLPFFIDLHLNHAIIAFFATLIIIGVGGGLLGSLLMATYLFLANFFYGGHDEEVFSSQAIEEYKCFARFHITKKKVTVYPVGLETVPKDWKPAAVAKNRVASGLYEQGYAFDVPDTVSPVFEPADGTKLKPKLIEKPIELS